MFLTPSPVVQQPECDTSKMGVLTAGRGADRGEIKLIAHNDIYLAGYSQDWLRKHNTSISSYRKYLYHAKDKLNRAIQDLRGAHGESEQCQISQPTVFLNCEPRCFRDLLGTRIGIHRLSYFSVHLVY